MHHSILVAMIFTIVCCTCRVGPPPLHFDAAHAHECQGDIDHWHWDRCALPAAVVWTSLFFGHRQKSVFELNKVSCTHDMLTLGDLSNCQNSQDAQRLIMYAQERSALLSSGNLSHYKINRCSSPTCQPQYTAFDAENPCVLPTQPILPLNDARMTLLPPVTLSLYIDDRSNYSKWSWWKPSLNFSFAVLSCAQDASSYHEWALQHASLPASFRCCRNCAHNHFPNDSLRLHANTEYLLETFF